MVERLALYYLEQFVLFGGRGVVGSLAAFRTPFRYLIFMLFFLKGIVILMKQTTANRHHRLKEATVEVSGSGCMLPFTLPPCYFSTNVRWWNFVTKILWSPLKLNHIHYNCFHQLLIIVNQCSKHHPLLTAHIMYHLPCILFHKKFSY